MSTCILSARLCPTHRQWAAQQLVKTIAKQSVDSGFYTSDSQVDLAGDMPDCNISRLTAHQNKVMDCRWNAKKNLLASSAHDGTIRIWNLPNKTHHILQQTCVFAPGDQVDAEELDGKMLSNLCWSPTGKHVACSVENMVNVWQTAGKTKSGFPYASRPHASRPHA